MPSLYSEIETCLKKYGESLKPSESFQNECRHLAHNVFLKVQKLIPKEFAVAEPRYGGSFGKATGVNDSDLDLCIVVKNKLPRFDGQGGVLNAIEDILLEYQQELQITPGSIVGRNKNTGGRPRVSIRFSFCNLLEVDVVAATKLTPIEVLAEIAKNPKDNCYIYHPSLIPVQLAFMASQDSFTHSLVRISKHWFKSRDFGGKNLFGGSTLMESISCAAAAEESSLEKRSMLRAFERVLLMVSRIDNLKLAFERLSTTEDEYPDSWQWKLVPSSELERRSSSLIPKVVGTRDILKQKCFIIDPSNPYLDQLQLDSEDDAVIKKLKSFAAQTINKLKILHLLAQYFVVTDELYVRKLFATELTDLTSDCPSGATSDFLCGYSYSYPSCNPDIKIRNENVYKIHGVKLFVEAMKWNLVHAVSSSVNGTSNDGNILDKKSQTVNRVTNAVREVLRICLNTNLALSTVDNHDAYDVTLTIPYCIDDVGYAVKCSLRWK